jgi:hypothetical protein
MPQLPDDLPAKLSSTIIIAIICSISSLGASTAQSRPPPPPPSQILYAHTCIYSLIYNVQVVFLPAVVALKNKLVRFSSNDVVGRSTVEKAARKLV